MAKSKKHHKKISKKSGLPPGSVVFVGKKKTSKLSLEVIDFTKSKYQKKKLSKVEQSFPFKKKPTVTWLNIVGLHETKPIEKLGKHYGIHPLTLEDVANTNQRPKLEVFDKYLFLTLRMASFNEKTHKISTEQVSIVLGKNFVLTFQERPGDVLDPVRHRIENKKGRVRNHKADYLAYALIDCIVDNYFEIIEKIGDHIEELESSVLANPNPKILNKVHKLKRDLIFMRRAAWPLREVISGLQRTESKLIDQGTDIYLRDLYDHVVQILDSVETFRDMASGLSDLYLSSVSNKMNEIMKVLTIFAAIFIPLTFIAGVYGMNFKYMPELNWKYGYAFAWSIMVLMGAVMMWYFRRKKWV